MSLSLHHVKHVRMLKHSEFETIEEAFDYCKNHRSGQTTNYWGEFGGVGFTYFSTKYVSVFALDDASNVREIQLFNVWPVD